MAWLCSLRCFAGRQVHLDVGLIRLAAHVVVAHQPVEVIGAGGSGISLVVQDIRLPRKFITQRLSDSRCLFERRAVRHIDDDLQFALVVERQHLHAHQSQRHERDRDQQQHRHSDEEQETIARGSNQRRHDAAIEPGSPVLGLGLQYLGALKMLAEKAERGPGRNHKSNQSEKSIAAEAPTGMGRI